MTIDAAGNFYVAAQLDDIAQASCTNPLFLVRIAIPTGAAGLWIATGAERTFE
jgi:hypothetical protein